MSPPQPSNPQDGTDVARLSRLLDRHAGALMLYARQLCGDPEDVVQLAFIKLASLEVWPEDSRAWLYRVVRNEAVSQRRSEQRRREREQAIAQHRKSWFVSEPGTQIDAGRAVESLAQLEQQQREIVVARIWGGLSFREIGELIGVSQSTAHREYQNAIFLLQSELNEPCPPPSQSLNSHRNR
ncbi:RNA polymerase sigma factor [Bremerella sp. JC817]|uniref:RNA polymerase sigma factor n=1 Tax=Bremerella sp. JC817 TaxID=3231756 RepID=UPI0034597D7A